MGLLCRLNDNTCKALLTGSGTALLSLVHCFPLFNALTIPLNKERKSLLSVPTWDSLKFGCPSKFACHRESVYLKGLSFLPQKIGKMVLKKVAREGCKFCFYLFENSACLSLRFSPLWWTSRKWAPLSSSSWPIQRPCSRPSVRKQATQSPVMPGHGTTNSTSLLWHTHKKNQKMMEFLS